MSGKASRKTGKNNKKTNNYRIITSADKAAAKKARAEHRQSDTEKKESAAKAALKEQKKAEAGNTEDQKKVTAEANVSEKVKNSNNTEAVTVSSENTKAAVSEKTESKNDEKTEESLNHVQEEAAVKEEQVEMPPIPAVVSQDSDQPAVEEESGADSAETAEIPVFAEQKTEAETKKTEEQQEESGSSEKKEEVQIPSFKAEEEKKTEQKPIYFRTITEKEIETDFVTEYKDQPAKINRWKRIVDPVSCMLEQAVSGVHKNNAHALLLIIVKYCLIGIAVAIAMSAVLNTEPFSFARMTFSDASYLFIRIVGLGFISEMLTAGLRSLLAEHRLFGDGSRRYLDIIGEASISIGIVYAIASLLFIRGFIYGVGGYIVAISLSALLHGYAYEFAYRCGRRRAMLASIIACAAAVILAFIWIDLTGSDLLRILRSFIDF